jgi:arsenical pump membrane protein
VRHPSGRTEATAGALAAVATLSTGMLTSGDLRRVLGELGPVVAFLVTILVVAEACARSGLFVYAAQLVVRTSAGRPRALFTGVFVLAALVTVALSLDATVVLLAPLVVAAAVTLGDSPWPGAFACLRMANSASLLLPVSNLTNLLALPYLHLTFTGFAAAMAPVWLVVLIVEYVGLRLLFAEDLHLPAPVPPPRPELPPRPTVPLVAVALMLTAFGVLSPLGVEPFWVSGVTAVGLACWGLATGVLSSRRIAHAAHLGFAVYVLGLGVVVAALTRGGLGTLVAGLLPSDTGFWGLLAVAGLATLLCAAFTNLSATLLLVPLVAPLGTSALLAALLGLNIGAGLTWTGSLANLLWRRTLVRQGLAPGSGDFHRVSLTLTPIALVAATAALSLTS